MCRPLGLLCIERVVCNETLDVALLRMCNPMARSILWSSRFFEKQICGKYPCSLWGKREPVKILLGNTPQGGVNCRSETHRVGVYRDSIRMG